MRKICLTVEYDGTEYCGYQMQSNVPTVQGAIESAIFKLCGERVRTVAAGRTDAKVHALGQVVSFFTSSSIPDERFAVALNTKFCSSGSSVKTTTRNVTRFELSTFKDPFLGHTFLSFEVEANGFLYNMVWIMVSTVMEVGIGRLGLDEVSRILDGADRRLAPPPMPPQGLYLVKVDYDLMT